MSALAFYGSFKKFCFCQVITTNGRGYAIGIDTEFPCYNKSSYSTIHVNYIQISKFYVIPILLNKKSTYMDSTTVLTSIELVFLLCYDYKHCLCKEASIS